MLWRRKDFVYFPTILLNTSLVRQNPNDIFKPPFLECLQITTHFCSSLLHFHVASTLLLLLLQLGTFTLALNSNTMSINQIAAKIGSIELSSQCKCTHDNLVSSWSKIGGIALQEPIEHRAAHDEIVQASLHHISIMVPRPNSSTDIPGKRRYDCIHSVLTCINVTLTFGISVF